MVQLELKTYEICEKLQSADRKDRQNALKGMLDCAESESISNEDIEKVYEEIYLHLIKCYGDKFESCRESATLVVTAFIKRLPKNDFYLQNIISTLADRIGKREIIETSEEMRLIFLQQTNFLISTFRTSSGDGRDYLCESYSYIIDIIFKTLTDPYPSVQKEACSCIVNLSTATPSFHIRAESLTTPLYSLLHHKHAANRIAAVEALGLTALHINANGDCLSRIFTEISPLLMDSMPLVREECGKVGCNMLISLRDRYSYFERIIPLVLCCLKDESLEIQHRIRTLWVKCGKQYFEENESELSKVEIGDSVPELYPEDVERPTLGCRALVQRSLRITKLIMRESSDWKVEVRLHALKLLYQFALHAEDVLTAKFFEIYSDLARSCADQDVIVATEGCKVANLLGRLLKYNDWFVHALEGLSKNCKLGYVKCFSELLTATNATKLVDLLKVTEIIKDRDFSHNLRSDFQIHLLILLEIIWSKYCSLETNIESLTLDSTKEEIIQNCYETTVKVMAISIEYPDQQIFNKGQAILLKLTSNSNLTERSLHSKYLKSIIDSFDCLDSALDGSSEPIILLHGIIRIARFQPVYLSAIKEQIKTVLEHAVPDGKIKIMSAISVAMLHWSESMSIGTDDSIVQLKEFVNDIIIYHLTWQAGASAESMRTLAAGTLCAMVQGAPQEAPFILSSCAQYFPSIIEDRSISTRLFAIKCFENFGPTSLEQLKPIGYAILQRLDDPSSDVRECAAKVLCKLKLSQLEENEQAIWNTFLKKSIEMLLLHFDGPEVKLKYVIKGTLQTMAMEHKELFAKCVAKASISSSSMTEIHQLLAIIEN